MSRPPIGEVLVGLDLLRPAQVDDVLSELRKRRRGRFGETALAMGLVDEDGLATAVALQHRLPLLPAGQVASLGVGSEVLELLPHAFMRDRLVVPTFFETDRRILSLVISDPTDLPMLEDARSYADAVQLRLFVTTRYALSRLIDRLLARASPADEAPRSSSPRPRRPVVLEPDAERLALLRRLDGLEGGRCAWVTDPDQLTALIDAGSVERVLHRSALRGLVEPYIGAWRRLDPMLEITELPGFSPGFSPAVHWDTVRAGWFDMLQDTLLLNRRDQPALRSRRGRRLAEDSSAALSLSRRERDAIAMAALFAENPPSPEVLSRSPVPIAELLARLDDRRNGRLARGEALDVEVLHTVLTLTRAKPAANVRAALGSSAEDHLDIVMDAADRALRREALAVALRAADPHMPIGGQLRDMDLAELLDALNHAQAIAEVSLTGAAERGLVYTSSGRVVAASCGGLRGREALKVLLARPTGRFELRFGQRTEERDVEPDQIGLLASLR